MAPSRRAAWWLHRDCQQLMTADRDEKKRYQSLIDDYFFIHKHQHGTSHWQFMVECGCSEGHLHHLWITNTAFMCASLHFTNLCVFCAHHFWVLFSRTLVTGILHTVWWMRTLNYMACGCVPAHGALKNLFWTCQENCNTLFILLEKSGSSQLYQSIWLHLCNHYFDVWKCKSDRTSVGGRINIHLSH